MQVSALAEAFVNSRRPDGTICLKELHLWLSRARLDEMARAVASLSQRINQAGKSIIRDPEHPWF